MLYPLRLPVPLASAGDRLPRARPVRQRL